MINIAISLSVVGISDAYVDVVSNSVGRMIFTSEVRETSQFENRIFGPA
jgi:hypothetical protein